MSMAAVITMIVTMTLVTSFAAYFFWKVLKTPPKPEPDSYSENER